MTTDDGSPRRRVTREGKETKRRDKTRRDETTRAFEGTRERGRAPGVIHPSISSHLISSIHSSDASNGPTHVHPSIHPSILDALETPSSTEPDRSKATQIKPEYTRYTGHAESRTDTTRRAIDRAIEGRRRASLDDGRRGRAR